jgi:TRAP-type C4-dicarboxylate transport system permease small subunit
MRLKDLTALTPGGEHDDAPAVLHWLHVVVALVTASLLVIAIGDMLIGVLLRYVVSKATHYFDLPNVDFFWVEEIGEFTLAWMTMLGAALGIVHGTHFRLQLITHRLPRPLRLWVSRVAGILVAIFGAVAALYGWQVALLNSDSASPGLSINLFWLYLSAVVGGGLMVVFGLTTIIRPTLADLGDGSEVVE